MSSKRKKIKTPFAENLAKLLHSHSLTQRETAKMTGVSVSVINSWLSGGVPHDLNAVLSLCKALNADFQLLLTGDSSKPKIDQFTLEQLFHLETDQNLSGLFLIDAKRISRKMDSTVKLNHKKEKT